MAIRVNQNVLRVKSSLKKAVKKNNPLKKEIADFDPPEKTFNVKSSNLKKISYDNALRELRITFLKGNRTYLYSDVPSYIYLKLLNASSQGEYFHKFIRFHYDYSEVKLTKAKVQRGK